MKQKFIVLVLVAALSLSLYTSVSAECVPHCPDTVQESAITSKTTAVAPTFQTLTSEDILILYENYLNTQGHNPTDEIPFSNDIVESFTQYAVEQSIISDSDEQRSNFTIAFYRAQFQLAADAGDILGYTTAATLLEHSLQDSPTNFIQDATSIYATQISNSSEGKNIISSFKNAVLGKNYTNHTISGSVTLNSTTDLHLAYNKVSYTATGVKNSFNNKWTLIVTFYDTYDFEKQAWGNSMTDSILVTAINNYADAAESAGAIVPYNIQITITSSFADRSYDILGFETKYLQK